MTMQEKRVQQRISVIAIVLLALLFGVKQVLAADATEYRPAAMTRISSTPVGAITAWPVGSLPADGTWAECDGRNGTPDLRGRFIRGVDAKHTLGSYQADENKLHSHTIKAHEHDVVGTAEGQVVTVASQGVSGKLSGTYLDSHLEGSNAGEWYRGDGGSSFIVDVGGSGGVEGSEIEYSSTTDLSGGDAAHAHSIKIKSSSLYAHDTLYNPDNLYLENNKVKTAGGTYKAQASNASGTALSVSQVTDDTGDATDDGHPKNVALRYIMKIR